jgi:hypothetical protein
MKENKNDQSNQDKTGNQLNKKTTQNSNTKETDPNNPTATKNKQGQLEQGKNTPTPQNKGKKA